MSGFSRYTDRALLNALFGKTSSFGALASAPTIYVALSTTEPSKTGTNVTEPTGNGYERVETAAADWSEATDASPAVVSNAEEIEFPTAAGDWAGGANIGYFALYDAATGGNFLGRGPLDKLKPVLSGDTPIFGVGELKIELGDAES